MKEILEIQKKIVPEMIDLLEKRYNILRSVYFYQPVGRRTLASNLSLGERIIRTEVNNLKNQGLIDIDLVGMSITESGKKVVEDLQEFIHEAHGLSEIENNLAERLKIKKVIVIPGNYDEDEYIIKDIARVASDYVKRIITDGSKIGVTGGTTMHQIVSELTPANINKDFLVVPARGGVGSNIEIQSNNVAAMLAQKLKGRYKLLQAPDNITKEAYDSLVSLEEIKELIEIIEQLDILVFGIGRADQMAKRRKLESKEYEVLQEGAAVAEAFGYYFDILGNIVKESNTIGLKLKDFKKIRTTIGVACGEEKAEAIVAISALKNDLILITDEGAAQALLNIKY